MSPPKGNGSGTPAEGASGRVPAGTCKPRETTPGVRAGRKGLGGDAGDDPGAASREEGAWWRRGPGTEGAGARRSRASRARGRAAPRLKTDSGTLECGGLGDLPRGERGYGQSCCLIEDGERCVRPAGNASFSKRVQKSISQKKLKLDIDKSVRHLYICDFHKNFIQSVRNKRKRKTSDDGGDSPEHDTDIPEVDLFQLQVNTLRRYKRHYKLQTRPGFNKAQLAETVSRHFRNIPVNEKETLAYFIYMVKSNKSRLDQKSESGKQLE
uniref:Histone deacetylase complex subunit SAP30L n=1 Tax=Capra hircus TaxID=9925 RepID=A0A8C2XWV3_CAPHI